MTDTTADTATKTIAMVDYLELGDEPHLVAQACTTCGALYFDRRNACASCEGRTFEPRALATTGKLRTFSIIHRSAPGLPSPYTSAVVDLDGGGSIKANLLGVDDDPAKITLNMAVRLVTFPVGTDDDGTTAIAFGFEPAEKK